MRIDASLRFDKAEAPQFTKHKTADGTKGVLVVDAPLARKDAGILGCEFLADATFDSYKCGEDIEEIGVEYTTSGDVAPFELIPEKITAPIVTRGEAGLTVRLRIHVTDGHVAMIDSFFDRPNPGPFSLVVRPLQAKLFDGANEQTEVEEKEDEPVTTSQINIAGPSPIAFRLKSGKAIAYISPEERDGGYCAVYEAAFRFRHKKHLSPEGSLAVTDTRASEREAIEVAACRISQFLDEVRSQQPAEGERIAANQMQDWLRPYLPEAGPGPAEVVAEEIPTEA